MKVLQLSTLLGAAGAGALVCLTVSAQHQGYFRPIGLTPEQSEILSHMEIVYLQDGQGGQAKTIRITGVNVQIVNGLGATNGNPKRPSYVPALGSAARRAG